MNHLKLLQILDAMPPDTITSMSRTMRRAVVAVLVLVSKQRTKIIRGVVKSQVIVRAKKKKRPSQQRVRCPYPPDIIRYPKTSINSSEPVNTETRFIF